MISYYRGLTAALEDQPAVESLVAFVPGHAPTLGSFGPKARVVRCSVPVNRIGRVVYEQVVLPWLANRSKVEVLLSTCNTRPLAWRAPNVVVLQSMQFMTFPRTYSGLRLRYLRTMVPLAVRTADAVIAVSSFERDEAIKAFRLDPDRVFVVYHGVPEDLISTDHSLRDRAGAQMNLDEPYILMVSTLYAYKNHTRLISAFARAVSRDGLAHDLVVAGGDADVTRRELSEHARRLGIDGRVRFLGAVPRENVADLIAGADLVAYPSLYETFGLPILEALALGAPLVTSNLAAMSEIAGDAALLVDPYNEENLALALTAAATDKQVRARLRASGYQRAAMFSWRSTAEGTIAALRFAIDRRRATPPVC